MQLGTTGGESAVLRALTESVIGGEAEQAMSLARQALELGLEPMRAIDEGLIPGIMEVGRRFEAHEFFLPELIMAAEAMKKGMAVLEEAIVARGGKREALATVVLGTVKGDIHDIGKSIVGAMLTAHGFVVVDLGVDVPADRFLAEVEKHGAQVLGMSALLPTTMPYMQHVIEELTRRGLRDRVKVVVGGAPVTPAYAERIGADGYGDDAISGVRVVRGLLGLA
ncbi:MAG: corrinoid protein [Anaerolineae bacterium]|nr:corrinoid protein [Anaerolineae bacterium]